MIHQTAAQMTLIVADNDIVCIHPCVWTFHLQFLIQVRLQYIHPLFIVLKSGESDYNHSTIVCNKQASWCFCIREIQVLDHLKVKRNPE